MYFSKNPLYAWAWIRKTKCIVMMTREGSTKIVNFVTPGAGVFVPGRGHISYRMKYVRVESVIHS